MCICFFFIGPILVNLLFILKKKKIVNGFEKKKTINYQPFQSFSPFPLLFPPPLPLKHFSLFFFFVFFSFFFSFFFSSFSFFFSLSPPKTWLFQISTHFCEHYKTKTTQKKKRKKNHGVGWGRKGMSFLFCFFEEKSKSKSKSIKNLKIKRKTNSKTNNHCHMCEREEGVSEENEQY